MSFQLPAIWIKVMATILSEIQALDTKRPVASLGRGDLLICHPYYPASVVLFQLHGGMFSHMQAFIILNT